MTSKVLIAIDDSENAMRAVEFVARFVTKDHAITLMSVVPDTSAISQLGSAAEIPHIRTRLDVFFALEEQKKANVKNALQKARDLLLQAGFAQNKVAVKLETEKKNVAKDIIDEAHNGYDIIVMGRRGLSGLKEFVLGSVSHKVLHAAKGLAVVVVE